MTDQTTRSRRAAGHGGLIERLLGLTSALAGFFQARAALMATESRAALTQCAVVAISLFAALILFALGYIFVVMTAVVAVAHLIQVSWLWTALVAGVLHFVIAGACLLIARATMIKPMFRATSAEFKKDAEWLKTLNTTGQLRS